jgi:hypothetical protein
MAMRDSFFILFVMVLEKSSGKKIRDNYKGESYPTILFFCSICSRDGNNSIECFQVKRKCGRFGEKCEKISLN